MAEQVNIGDYLKGLARALGPDLAGLPVDTATNVLNLLIAGGGVAAHKAGLVKQPPDLIEKPFGGSDWFAEKTNVPDTGSGEYTAGRLTPMLPMAAKAAGVAAKGFLNAALSAPSGKTAQRGAIRVGGDPDLFATHATTEENLLAALSKGRTLELYSPSIAITKNVQPAGFGDLILVPKVGAFDPATSPSTLFNRDAWTSRYGDYHGETVGNLVKPIKALVPLQELMPFEEFETLVNRGLLRTDNLKGPAGFWGMKQSWEAMRPEEAIKNNLNKYLRSNYKYVDSPNYLDDLQSHWRDWGIEKDLGNALNPSSANLRMQDRFHGVRPEDTKLNEGEIFGKQGSGPGGLHELAIKDSPAFRSFAQYEKSHLGAKLLDSKQSPTDFQKRALRNAFDSDAWIGIPAMASLTRAARRGKDTFRQAWESHGPRVYQANGFSHEDFVGDTEFPGFLDEFYKKALLAGQALKRTPSEYAELKVHGPAPVNAENWAMGFIRPGSGADFPEAVIDAMGRQGVEIFKPGVVPHDPAEMTAFIRRFQEAQGPARRQPIP